MPSELIRENMFRFGNFMRINDAIVEELSCSGSRRSILISHQPQRTSQPQTIRLNINQNTVVLNALGQSISPCSLRRGTRIDAVISAAMTRSIPPQTTAFHVQVL